GFARRMAPQAPRKSNPTSAVAPPALRAGSLGGADLPQKPAAIFNLGGWIVHTLWELGFARRMAPQAPRKRNPTSAVAPPALRAGSLGGADLPQKPAAIFNLGGWIVHALWELGFARRMAPQAPRKSNPTSAVAPPALRAVSLGRAGL